MKYVVNISSGLASAEALERTIDRYGMENTIGVFADVKGHSIDEHAGEDEDNYRFLSDIERWFNMSFVRIVEGRDIWQVMFDERAITIPVGPTKVAKCSIKLKREPIDAWVKAQFAPSEATMIAGLGWDEPHRIEAFSRAKAPYPCWFPLNERPYLDKCQLAEKWESRGIKVPALYELGFTHANCGGFCVKAGQAHFALLYRVNRERYMYHAEKEKLFRETINAKATILAITRNKVKQPITLYDFAAMIESGEYDKNEWGGCGCFAPVQQLRMEDMLLEVS